MAFQWDGEKQDNVDIYVKALEAGRCAAPPDDKPAAGENAVRGHRMAKPSPFCESLLLARAN